VIVPTLPVMIGSMASDENREHAMKTSIRRPDTKIVGKGGMRCYCCTTGKPRDSKLLITRRDRRTSKQFIKVELGE
jgi:hypothetical protein